LAEVIKLGIDHPETGGKTAYPESHFIVPRLKAQKRSMLRAGIITVAALGVGTWLLLRKR
jgi:hypothetical protein